MLFIWGLTVRDITGHGFKVSMVMNCEYHLSDMWIVNIICMTCMLMSLISLCFTVIGVLYICSLDSCIDFEVVISKNSNFVQMIVSVTLFSRTCFENFNSRVCTM